jgi:N6-adenosine-specific RNA methylase IME4
MMEADQAYGSLTEGIHIAGYTLERAFRKLEWLLAENTRWTSVGGGYEDVNDFMDTIKFDTFKIIATERKKIAASIKKLQPKVSNRAIAKVVGVDPQTINNDLAEKSADGKTKPKKDKAGPKGGAEFSAPGRLGGAAAAATVAKAEAKEERQAAKDETRKEDEVRILSLSQVTGKFPTLVIDPPWDYEGLSLAGRAAPLYAVMSHEELMAFDVARWALDDCAMYLWVTNNFMTRGVELMAKWGFAHKTVLTWVKPRIGLGSYFRNSTEHALFGVRGNMKTRRDDMPTHFEAPTTGHSIKPEKFYEIVRAASYPEFGELFQREARPDFKNLYQPKAAGAAA